MADFISSEADFLSLLNKPNEVVQINGYHFDGHVNIKSHDFNCIGLELYNCVIKGVFFKDINVQGHLVFNGCIIDKFGFYNVIVDRGDAELTYGANIISLKECIIHEFLTFNNCKANNIGIYNSELNEFECSGTALKIGGLGLITVKVNSFGIVRNNVANGSIDFLDCTINRLFFEENDAMKMSFSSSSFGDHVLINNNFSDVLNISHCPFEKEVYFNGIKKLGKLNILKCKFPKKCNINIDEYTGDQPSKISLSQSSFAEGCDIGQLTAESIGPINRHSIEEIDLDFSENLSGIFKVTNCTVGRFIIKGTNHKANLIVDNVSIETWEFQDFSNYSNVQFLHCQSDNSPQSNLSVFNSYLGKTQFFEVDFSGFDSVDIRNSHLSEIITSCVNWFTPKKLLESGKKRLGPVDEESEEGKKELAKLYSSKKEIFRQLKVAMEKHGSQADYLYFKQAEMDYYGAELENAGGDLKDRFILFTNKSNDHGQNWLKPILLAIAFTALFYFLIVIASSDKLSSVPSGNTQHIIMTLQELWERGRLFFVLFNPVRSLEKTVGAENITGVVEFLDLLHRILISYFIFQTVSAFRKYTKN